MTTVIALHPRSYQEGTGREWLVANGLGGYASATVAGSNTRSYHGLLVAAEQPPVGRWLLLSSLDEEIDGISLACHQYPGVIHPQGFKYLQEFRQNPFPRFCYQVGAARIEKTVFMIRGENTTIISYRIENGEGLMRLVPLVHSRSFHSASPLPGMSQAALGAGTALQSGQQGRRTSLSLLSDGPAYLPQEMIYHNFEYEEERRRGLAWKEDLFSPGRFEIELSGDDEFALAASAWRTGMPDWRAEQKREKERLEKLQAPLPALAQAADSFLVKRGSSLSIIAGYHWFDDWGRDAMIALPGLLLSTERFEEAKMVLKSFAGAMKDGVLPNDLGAGSYNTVDASLWFVQAVRSYYEQTHDLQFIEQLWPRLLEVFSRYCRPGVGFGGAEDGLIASGPALTWMDARLESRPVTPRSGKCCDVNALWFCALRFMQEMEKAVQAPSGASLDQGFAELAEKVRQSYQRFWNSETGCLFDVIDPEDASIRPNQIIAARVPGLLPEVMRKSILEVAALELLTPFGLRTLSPRDPRYAGRYEGDPGRRDGAYHQGTVWPWLMGPYIDALLSINGRSGPTLAQARELLRPLLSLHQGGVNTLPEVFDGDQPRLPGGCISQAWSVAEVLRAFALLSDGNLSKRTED